MATVDHKKRLLSMGHVPFPAVAPGSMDADTSREAVSSPGLPWEENSSSLEGL